MAGNPDTMALARGSRPPEHSHKSASLRSWIADLIDKSRPEIDPKEGFIMSVWSQVEDDYHKMADELATACREELSNRSIPAAVESRVKSRGSIAKSLDRRELYRQTRKEEPYRNIHEILQDLHDLVGIRIIVDYVNHIEATTTFVTTTFRKEKESNVFSANRKVGHSWKAWFGAYECTNHHVSAVYGEHNPLSHYNGVIFEIQITSLPANLYNKIAHPLLYKEEAGDLSQGDEIVIDLTKGLAFCYSLCTYYKRHKLDGKLVDTNDLELMQKASSSLEGPEFMSSISELAGRIPDVDATEIKGKSIPRERLEMVLESLLNKEIQNDIGKSVADQLRYYTPHYCHASIIHLTEKIGRRSKVFASPASNFTPLAEPVSTVKTYIRAQFVRKVHKLGPSATYTSGSKRVRNRCSGFIVMLELANPRWHGQ